MTKGDLPRVRWAQILHVFSYGREWVPIRLGCSFAFGSQFLLAKQQVPLWILKVFWQVKVEVTLDFNVDD